MMSPIDPNGEDIDLRRISYDGKDGKGREGGLIPSISVEMDETPTRPRRTGRSPSGGVGGGGGAGLNIRGLTLPTAGKITNGDSGMLHGEKEEGSDSLGDLIPSPRVSAFKASLLQPSPEMPMSPAWQSFDASPVGNRASSSRRNGNGNGIHPASPSVLFAPPGQAPSPLGPGGNERRFDPTPTHGLHARNLSLFFPSPGQQRTGNGSRGKDVFGEEGFDGMGQENGPDTVLPAGEDRKVFGGKGGWSFGGGHNGSTAAGQTLSPENAKSSKRRGHHVSCLIHEKESEADELAQTFAISQFLLIPRSDYHESVSRYGFTLTESSADNTSIEIISHISSYPLAILEFVDGIITDSIALTTQRLRS